MLLSLGTVTVALVAGNGRCHSCHWDRSWVISSQGLVAVALVTGIVCGCSLIGSGSRWLLSEAVFGAFFGRKPEMIIELA